MALVMRHPFSNSVAEIGHDPDTGELVVVWKKSGKTSVYAGVSAEKAKSVMNAPSVGEAVHAQIKPHHEHRYFQRETTR